MKKLINDYTHTEAKIEDIRRIIFFDQGKNERVFFAIKVEDVSDILYVNYDIFNDRVKTYFLGKKV